MAIKSLQVTQTGSAVQFPAVKAKWAVIQNNAAAVCRVADSAVTASLGYSLAAAGAVNSNLPIPVPPPGAVINLSDWWTVGTNTQLLDVVYDSVNF